MWSCPSPRWTKLFLQPASRPQQSSKHPNEVSWPGGQTKALHCRLLHCSSSRLPLGLFQNPNLANPNLGAQATRSSSKASSNKGRQPTSRAPSGLRAAVRRPGLSATRHPSGQWAAAHDRQANGRRQRQSPSKLARLISKYDFFCNEPSFFC